MRIDDKVYDVLSVLHRYSGKYGNQMKYSICITDFIFACQLIRLEHTPLSQDRVFAADSCKRGAKTDIDQFFIFRAFNHRVDSARATVSQLYLIAYSNLLNQLRASIGQMYLCARCKAPSGIAEADAEVCPVAVNRGGKIQSPLSFKFGDLSIRGYSKAAIRIMGVIVRILRAPVMPASNT